MHWTSYQLRLSFLKVVIPPENYGRPYEVIVIKTPHALGSGPCSLNCVRKP